MAVTSIPKTRLIKLIIDELKVERKALDHFKISSDTDIEARLESFSKDELLTFIIQLGDKAENELRKLETNFPLRRPPTLYIAIVDNKPSNINPILSASYKLAEKGKEGGMEFGENDVVRFIYLPQGGVSRFQVNKLTVLEFQLHYERRIEYVESSPKSNYGQLSAIYSLETAFIWLPVTKHNHVIIACSDYPAIRRIRNFMGIKLGINLNSPLLNKEMLEKIVVGSVPRSVTYSLNPLSYDEDEPQSITIADPDLQNKPIFDSLLKSDREQISGFYTAHPGLTLGGLGVARRDGKVWTPKKLDRKEILDLSMTIIEQTESELSKIKDVSILLKYFHSGYVKIGNANIVGKAKESWRELTILILEAIKNARQESTISPKLIDLLVEHQKQLKLLTSVKYDCPHCGLRWLAKCPDCRELLTLSYDTDLHSTCPKCKTIFDDMITCVECGGEVEVGDVHSNVNIFPEKEIIESVKDAADKARIKYNGLWMIDGLILLWVSEKQKQKYPILRLSDLKLWKKRAKIASHINSSLTASLALKVLNKTLEKCERDGTKASSEKCKECISKAIKPKWIKEGDTCLLRLFGLPIDEEFEGVHHKHELADIIYKDTIIKNSRSVKIGIHVKSRNSHCPPEGMGRSKYQIKGLYTQAIYSAFQSVVHGKGLQVIGVAIPNEIHQEVVDSLAYAINALGFSFLVVDEKDWLSVIQLAYEQAVFDNQN